MFNKINYGIAKQEKVVRILNIMPLKIFKGCEICSKWC